MFLFQLIENKNNMNFYSWKKNQPLFINRFGILEPEKTKMKIPNFMLIPILAFDKYKYRLGYGKGFYDRYLNKYLEKISKHCNCGCCFFISKTS